MREQGSRRRSAKRPPVDRRSSVASKGIACGAVLFFFAGSIFAAEPLRAETIAKAPVVSDFDGDQTVDNADNCPGIPNPGQENADGDVFGNACDACDARTSACESDTMRELTLLDFQHMSSRADSDHDGMSNLADNCPAVPNNGQLDRDRDGVGDTCDACPDKAARGMTDGCPASARP